VCCTSCVFAACVCCFCHQALRKNITEFAKSIEWRHLFDKLDINHDESLSPRELQAIVRRALTPTAEQSAAIMAQFDRNKVW
jgi:Ca2+-binding EF-hand superfamily protein